MVDITSSETTPNPIERRSKVLSVEESISTLVPGHAESLWVGGMHMHNVPMALVRECIRQGKRFETLYAGPSMSIAADLLIGAGSVERVVCAYIGFEHIGLAPAFRRAAEGGSDKPEIVEADSGSLVLGLQAGAWGQPFAPLPAGLERTSLPAASPGLYKVTTDPFTGADTLSVQRIRPSVALIHCQQSDEFGNGLFKGSPFNDPLIAAASETVIMQVESLINNNQVLKYPAQTGIASLLVNAVVPVNFGCHPTSSHRFYNYDDVHLRLYLKAAATAAGFNDYMTQYVYGAPTQDEYMRRVQNQEWIGELDY